MNKINYLKELVKGFGFLFCLILFLLNNSLKAQNVTITDDESYTPDNSAMLDIKSTNKGMLVPRLDSAQRVGISYPALGLLVFDTTKNSFMYYNGTNWITIPQLVTSAGSGDALFAVVNHLGDTVFAVYHDGVRVFVDPAAKGSVGGFAVSGRTRTKAGEKVEYFRVTPDSTRIYVNDSIGAKGSVGGFAVSGRTRTKEGEIKEYFTINKDSTRIYIDSSATKGSVGGFAVSGRTRTKGNYIPDDYFNVSAGSNADSIPSDARIAWYPKKEAFLAGRVQVLSPDSVGKNSFATGYHSRAKGDFSQAFGFEAKARGNYSTAIGKKALANSLNSFAFGDSAKALNIDTYALGSGAIASGIGSFAVGSAGYDQYGSLTGRMTTASASYAFAIGAGCLASNWGATAIGHDNTASGLFSTALGNFTTASGPWATSLGFYSEAYGSYSTAVGYYSDAGGIGSIALGYYASSSNYSTALGYKPRAWGDYSTACGVETEANGQYSTAFGYQTKANQKNTTVMGTNTVAPSAYETVLGRFNTDYTPSAPAGFYPTDRLFTVGRGTSTSDKKNAITVLKNGNIGFGSDAPTGHLEIGPDIISEMPGSISMLRLIGNSGNNEYLNTYYRRHTYGSGWAGTEYRIQKTVDVTDMHYISFKGSTLYGSTLEFGYGNNSLLILTNNGKVGVGNNPNYKLDVDGEITSRSDNAFRLRNTSYSAFLRNDNSSFYILLTNSGDPDGIWNSLRPLAINITNGDVNLGGTLQVSHLANVGIGTTSPASKLHVTPGQVRLDGTANPYIGVNNGTYQGYFEITSNILALTYNSAVRLGITSGGLIGVGRTATVNTLEVNGSASKTSAGDWLANSDQRIKTDITEIENACETMLKLHPVKFKYSNEYKKSHDGVEDKFYYNFIAQEYQQVFPESVKGSGEYINGLTDEILQMDSYNAQIVSIKAVQDLIIQNKQQQQQIELLKSELEAIKEEIRGK